MLLLGLEKRLFFNFIVFSVYPSMSSISFSSLLLSMSSLKMSSFLIERIDFL